MCIFCCHVAHHHALVAEPQLTAPVGWVAVRVLAGLRSHLGHACSTWVLGRVLMFAGLRGLTSCLLSAVRPPWPSGPESPTQILQGPCRRAFPLWLPTAGDEPTDIAPLGQVSMATPACAHGVRPTQASMEDGAWRGHPPRQLGFS